MLHLDRSGGDDRHVLFMLYICKVERTQTVARHNGMNNGVNMTCSLCSCGAPVIHTVYYHWGTLRPGPDTGSAHCIPHGMRACSCMSGMPHALQASSSLVYSASYFMGTTVLVLPHGQKGQLNTPPGLLTNSKTMQGTRKRQACHQGARHG